MRILDYDLERYPFPAIVADFLGTQDMTALSTGVEADEGASIYRNVQASPWQARLAAALSDERAAAFAGPYARFLREQIAPAFDEPVACQARPTFRMIFTDASGIPRFHRDSDYGHSPHEVNFSVALTPAYGTNAIWIESAARREDHAPIVLDPGQYVRFDGASLSHGVQVNDTGASRLSFDFRVLPVSRLDPARELAEGWPATPDPHLMARIR